MNEFKLNLTVEVDQVGNGRAIQTPVDLQICYNRGRWSAGADCPAFETDPVETLEKAIVTGARQAQAELQANVIDRPCVVARIRPEDVPQELR